MDKIAIKLDYRGEEGGEEEGGRKEREGESNLKCRERGGISNVKYREKGAVNNVNIKPTLTLTIITLIKYDFKRLHCPT